MNRLVLIGNGFDMAHGLKTSYKDFIHWYWDKRVEAFAGNTSKVSEDCLCKMTINSNNLSCWNVFASQNSYFKDIQGNKRYSGYEVIKRIKNKPDMFSVGSTQFFGTILQSIETKGWVDIENDYYQQLKRATENAGCGYTVKNLNEQLAFLQVKLIEYLHTIGTTQYKKELHDAMIECFIPADFSTEGRKKVLGNMGLENANLEVIQYSYVLQNKLIHPERIMLLSFNYTATAKIYRNFNLDYNYIHGELDYPKNIIFGYGDELDKKYQDILDMNDNELLKNMKSVKYLETRRYREMLEFIQSAPFQVFIMGHSCGNSDRTLLNTVFEHENCVSIKPFYHKWENGSDNYLDIVQNISRCFTNMKLFRDRVVNKEQCLTM